MPWSYSDIDPDLWESLTESEFAGEQLVELLWFLELKEANHGA